MGVGAKSCKFSLTDPPILAVIARSNIAIIAREKKETTISNYPTHTTVCYVIPTS